MTVAAGSDGRLDRRRDRARGPGRPTSRSRRAGRDAGHHLGAVAASARTRSSTRCARAAATTRDVPLRRDLHDPRAAARRGRRRRLPLPRPRARSCALRDAGELPRGERGPRQLVRHAARRRSARRWRPAATSILKIDVQGAQVVKERVAGGAPDLRRPAVARDAVRSGCAVARDRDRRRARAPPAQRRDRAGAPGGLRLRRRSTRPARSSGPPSGSTRSSPRSTAATRTGGSGSSARRVDARARAAVAERSRPRTRPPRRGRGRRGRGPAAPDVHVPRCRTRSPTSSPARRCSSSSAGGRRSRIVLGERDRARRASRPKPIVGPGPRRRPAAAAADPGARPLDRRPLPRAAGPRPPGDAAARLLERLELVAERTPGRAPADGGHGPGATRRPARPARRRPAARPRPRRRRRAGPGCSAGCARSSATGS